MLRQKKAKSSLPQLRSERIWHFNIDYNICLPATKLAYIAATFINHSTSADADRWCLIT